MRQLLLTLCLAAALPALAQQPDRPARRGGPVVSVGLPTLAGALGVQAEQPLGRHFSLSLGGARFFSARYPGYQGRLLARYYFRPTAPLGFYLQAQAGVFQHTGQVQAFYPGITYPPSDTRLGGAGGGLGLGYQLLLGRHLALNAGLGLRYYPIRNLGICDCSYVGDWYAVGQPGSWLDGQLSVGYAF